MFAAIPALLRCEASSNPPVPSIIPTQTAATACGLRNDGSGRPQGRFFDVFAWQWPSNRRPFVNLCGILMLLPCEQRMCNRIILLGKHEDGRWQNPHRREGLREATNRRCHETEPERWGINPWQSPCMNRHLNATKRSEIIVRPMRTMPTRWTGSTSPVTEKRGRRPYSSVSTVRSMGIRP